jgi:MFS superfamily sulfate permease-like transporter
MGNWSSLRSGMMPASAGDAGRDLTAALALAAVAIPEQLATARLAGVPASIGLSVFVAGALGFFLLGSNRALSVGADSTTAPIFAGSLALLAVAGSPHYMMLCAGLALMVGLIVGAGGLLRMGWIARLLSQPVITGFLAGIAVHIMLSQAPILLGVSAPQGGPADELRTILTSRPNPYAAAIGLFVFAATLVCEKFDRRIPGALLATLITAMAAALFGLAGRGVVMLDASQSRLSGLALPMLSGKELIQLVPVALIISLVVMIQSAATSRSFEEQGDGCDINRDFIGVGFGNLLSGLAGGFPANASPPRTAIVSESGGRSRLSGLCAAILVVLFLAFGLSLLRFLPQAALAGLLFFVARRIFRLDDMRLVARQSPAEFGLLAATAAAIVVLPVATGVGIGIGLSLLHGVWTIAQTRAVPFERIPGSTIWWPANPSFKGEQVKGVVVAGFQAPLFFLNAETFRQSLAATVAAAPWPVRAIILEGGSIAELDYSGAHALESVIKDWKAKDVDFYIARLESLRATAALQKFGVLPLLGEQRIFPSVEEAVQQLQPEFALA